MKRIPNYDYVQRAKVLAAVVKRDIELKRYDWLNEHVKELAVCNHWIYEDNKAKYE